jgi:hypothetical protein
MGLFPKLDWKGQGGFLLTIMPTVPRASDSVTLLPLFLRVGDCSNSSDDLMTRYDWKAVAEKTLLYYYVRVADADGKNFD